MFIVSIASLSLVKGPLLIITSRRSVCCHIFVNNFYTGYGSKNE
jgi:hypothetical protein